MQVETEKDYLTVGFASARATAAALDGFSLDSADAFETAFTRFIQFLASAACDPDFIPSVLDDQDPYFMPALARIDADVTVRKESVASNAWEPEFRVGPYGSRARDPS